MVTISICAFVLTIIVGIFIAKRTSLGDYPTDAALHIFMIAIFVGVFWWMLLIVACLGVMLWFPVEIISSIISKETLYERWKNRLTSFKNWYKYTTR